MLKLLHACVFLCFGWNVCYNDIIIINIWCSEVGFGLLHPSCWQWQWGPDAWTTRWVLLSVSLNASYLSAAEGPDSSQVIHTWQGISLWINSHIGKWITCHLMNERTQICTDLRTDSTNTLNAFKWIQATNTSLKFTFSQRTKIPYGGGTHICYTIQHTQTLQIADMMFDLHIVPSYEG